MTGIGCQVLAVLSVLSGLARGVPEDVAVFRYPDETELVARSANCVICSTTPVYRNGVAFRTVNGGDVIELDFISVGMETSNCRLHFIRVYDGTDSDAPLLKTVCDSQTMKVRSTGSTMALYYTWWDTSSYFRLNHYSYQGPNASSSPSLSGPKIVGIVVGVIVAVIIIAAVRVCLTKKNKRKTHCQRNRKSNSIRALPGAPPPVAAAGPPALSYPLNYTNHNSVNNQPSPFEKAAIQGLQNYSVPPPAFHYTAPPPYDQHVSYPPTAQP
ncbi:uncharacterized protein LOC124143828 [Haliotis rufescens]|uniref:uncharacterized protein LOC124143828 n=1 Tax=Haliotis rufescens TaxID=6454 RepID=UPI00201EDB9A|nr:uncharacterized protein LOC124143828 [Haliotis rufescens]XP_048238461.1 uncharacterized protein LOC124143828 [Haliotis rufescens]